MTAEKHLPQQGLDLLFNKAQTHHAWTDRPVTDAQLEEVLNLAKMGPTAFNQQPMRVIFARSATAKERLAPTLSPGNVPQTMAAPVTAIICYDLEFWRNLPELCPAYDATGFYKDDITAARGSAITNGTLQAGYFIMAARAVGLDCGPMTGFDKDAVAKEFVKDRPWEVNILVNLGYGDHEKLYPRAPRLSFARMTETI